jgi:hypothetical protein
MLLVVLHERHVDDWYRLFPAGQEKKATDYLRSELQKILNLREWSRNEAPKREWVSGWVASFSTYDDGPRGHVEYVEVEE